MKRLFESLRSVKLTKLPGASSLDSTRGGAYSTPYEPPVAMANMLTHIGLWPTVNSILHEKQRSAKFLDDALKM